MSYIVYVIRSVNTDWWYVGMTSDLDRRLLQHNRGQNRSTKPYLPFTLVYIEEHSGTSSAREREKYLKGTSGKRWLKKHFK